MTLVSEFRLMSLSVLYDLMYPVSVLTNVLSILDTFNTGVTKNMQITTKNHKNNSFTINLDSQNQVILSFLFFHKSNIAIYINHILSHFSFNIKNTNQLICLWLFILKPFSKLIKNT